MTKRTRTKDELKQKLDIQLRLLTNRCDSYYEDGEFVEAYSTATIVRVLVHDTSKSTSLLNQIGIKETTRYLDSRTHDNLYVMGTMNGYSGLHPRTRCPFQQYSEKHRFEFDEWWEGQKFKIVGIPFTRKELVDALANKEGGAHIDENPHPKLDEIKRSGSPYHAFEGEVSRPIYDAELASMCAIGEEILFTFTPEPENRKRMLWEPWQQPYYLSMKESDTKKEKMRASLLKLAELLEGEHDFQKRIHLQNAQGILKTALEVECLTSEDCEVDQGVAYLMKLAKVPWESQKP